MSHILVIGAHPDLSHSQVNRALVEGLHSAALPGVHYRDLYALYPDYLVDIAAEQAALEAAQLVVWQHPVQWYSMPALMKLWVDEVLAFHWAYGPGGRALKGKDLWLVATTGGTEDSYRPDRYNRYFFDAFLTPYDQTAVVCGMRFLPQMVLHGAHRVSDATVDAHAEVYAQRLASYPDWPEIASLEPAPPCDVAEDERPAPAVEPAAVTEPVA
jgi:glutathione-regulated potassium-efflux system ancillary protein KefF